MGLYAPGKRTRYPMYRRLDAMVKRKIPSPRRESNHRTPIIQRYTD
jgi:hypothetical protein